MSQNDVKQFVEAIRETIRQEVSKMSSDAVCEIESVNDDGTLNVYLLPDKTNIIRKIINQTRYNFNRGDYALLYLIKNRVSDSFVVAKYNPAAEDDIANYISKNDDSSQKNTESSSSVHVSGITGISVVDTLARVSSGIAQIPSASTSVFGAIKLGDEFTTDINGGLEISNVNFDKIKQDAGDYFVIDCGSSTEVI